MANCYRNINQVDEAKKYYRLVANSESEQFIISIAKWWLDAMDKKSVLIDQEIRIRNFNNQFKQGETDDGSTSGD